MSEFLSKLTELAEELEKDINFCSTRVEHIRVTARANAARELVNLYSETES